MSKEGHRRRVLTAEERVLWNMVARSIAPLRPGPNLATTPEHESAPAPRQRPAADKPLPVPVRSAPPLAPLGRRLRTRLGRGKRAIDARLDLHGLTQSEAHANLLRFLHAASARGARLVLVITGKGSQGGGVLRRQLPQWLALPEFRPLVIGFEQAHIAHGGEGAWYVSVRRSRAHE